MEEIVNLMIQYHHMKKKTLRQNVKIQRSQLSQKEKQEASALISEQVLKNFDLSNKTISIFLPIKQHNELDTFTLVEELQKNTAIKITVPVSDFSDTSLTHVCLEKNTKLELNTYGIPEPVNGNSVSPQEIDIVFVPLLAIDKRGYRVGYGKGFYDRFLSLCKPSTKFVGLNYYDPINTIDDINTNDVQLHFLVTPKKCWKF